MDGPRDAVLLVEDGIGHCHIDFVFARSAEGPLDRHWVARVVDLGDIGFAISAKKVLVPGEQQNYWQSPID